MPSKSDKSQLLGLLGLNNFHSYAEIIILSVDYTPKGITRFSERFRKTLFLEQLVEVTDDEAMPYRDRWPPKHQVQLTMYSSSAGFLVLYATCFAFSEEQDRMHPHPLKLDFSHLIVSFWLSLSLPISCSSLWMLCMFVTDTFTSITTRMMAQSLS